jgi:hypothetical protein
MMEKNEWTGGEGASSKKIKNLYAQGADDGLWMGLYLSAMFLSVAFSLKVAMLNLVALLLFVGISGLTYFFLRKAYRHGGIGMKRLSALWMQGITMFACAAIILGAVSYVYMRWIEPHFILNVCKYGIDYYTSLHTEEADKLAESLQQIISNGALPQVSTLVMAWMWLTVFGGSLLSLVVAMLLRMLKVKK